MTAKISRMVLVCALAGAMLNIGMALSFADDRDPSHAVKMEQPDPKTLKNKPAPAIELFDFDGVKYKLSDYRGRVVVVDFWASWCPHCADAANAWKTIENSKPYKNGELFHFAVNITCAPETVAKANQFLKAHETKGVTLSDVRGKAAGDYLVSGIPITFIIGRDGFVKDVVVGYGGEDTVKLIMDSVATALASDSK